LNKKQILLRKYSKYDMKKHLYLHIGTWKTGTTSIQDTFFNQRKLLRRYNVHYPDISSNHSFLPSSFHPNSEDCFGTKIKRLKGKALESWHQRSLKDFEKGLSSPNTVVSSEFLLGLKPEGIRKMKAYLSRLFDEITIVVYVRHPLDHISSAISEQVKQGHYGIDEAYRIHSKFRELEKIDNWKEVFGEKRMNVRAFDRINFINGDLIDDFLSIIFSSNIPQLPRLDSEKNPSLSYAGVLIADKLSAFAPSFDDKRGPSHYLQNISGPKFKISNERKKNLLNEFGNDWLEFSERYQLGFKFNHNLEPDLQDEDIWNDEVLYTLAESFNQLSLKCKNLRKENELLASRTIFGILRETARRLTKYLKKRCLYKN